MFPLIFIIFSGFFSTFVKLSEGKRKVGKKYAVSYFFSLFGSTGKRQVSLLSVGESYFFLFFLLNW